jgi:hypothetical protein
MPFDAVENIDDCHECVSETIIVDKGWSSCRSRELIFPKLITYLEQSTLLQTGLNEKRVPGQKER